MATVTIGTKDGEQIVLRNVDPNDEHFYDNLPFTSEDVLWTRVTP